MSHKIRLGPIAIFLTVIAAVLATLAMLTIATSRADAAMAERFAKVTSLRYELETDGNRFLQQLDSTLKSGGPVELPDGAEQLDNGNVHYNIEKEGYALDVEVAVNPEGAASDSGGTTVNAEGAGADSERAAMDSEGAGMNPEDDGANADSAASAAYEVVGWKITKIWQGADPFEDLWPGF